MASYKLILSPTQVFDLTEQAYSLGRDASNGIAIQGEGVSRRHAQLTRAGDVYVLQDMSSANGTFVNGQRISAPQPLNSGDKIGLGRSIQLLYEAEAAAAAPTPQPAPTRVAASEEPLPATMMGEPVKLPPSAEPPRLVVEEAGGSTYEYTLTAEQYTIGRSEGNTIRVTSPLASRNHARLEKTPGGYHLAPLPEVLNPLSLQGRPVSEPHVLRDGDIFRIGGRDPGTMITFRYSDPATAAEPKVDVDFGERAALSVGRDPTNDVRLDAPQVSRFHAKLEKIGARYRVRDLRSGNGTFVNGQRVEGEVWLDADDELRIGPYRFVMGADRLSQYDETGGGLRVEAMGLNKWVRGNLNILQNISLVIQPKEFVVVVGQSGGGKSTLVDSIAGYRPATHGKVFVNGIDIYRNFDAIRSNIGFVPQRDIIHMELTVGQALDYAAQLRMLPDTTPTERRKRVSEVLEELDLAHRKDVQISGLSGGQQKRVSIGVELLTKPGLFFLDEPTSGLDPGTETALMQLMRRMADQGRTIILITHATKNVMLADKVIFLARGGYLAWYGPPDEALRYFDKFRSERDRRAGPMEFDQIYEILDDASQGSPKDWHKRFQGHMAYQQYIAKPLSKTGAAAAGAPAASRPAPRRRQISALRQFLILSARNLKILTRDRFSLILMLITAPIVSSLDIIVALLIGRNVFDYDTGSANYVITTLFMMAMYAVMVGSLSQMREIVKEQDIYRRERLVNLKIIPYISSKVWVAGMLALYQAACYVIIRYIAFSMEGGFIGFVFVYITMVLATMSGMMLGLFASAISPNANAAPLLVIIFLLPQIVLGGAIIPLPGWKQVVSTATTTRWTYEALVSITGLASDVAGDLCWQISKEEREALTTSEKEAQGCRCLGTNIFRGYCNFPGAGKYYDPAIDQPEPVKPAEVTDPLPALVLPDPPPQPGSQNDPAAMSQYMRDMQSYQDQVDVIKAQYQADINAYKRKTDDYQDALRTYSDEYADWQSARTEAIGQAEGVIGSIYDDFGWAFVDWNDSLAWGFKIITRWAAQAFMSIFFFVVILIVQKVKDLV